MLSLRIRACRKHAGAQKKETPPKRGLTVGQKRPAEAGLKSLGDTPLEGVLHQIVCLRRGALRSASHTDQRRYRPRVRPKQLGDVALRLPLRRLRDSSYERAARQGHVRTEANEQPGSFGY